MYRGTLFAFGRVTIRVVRRSSTVPPAGPARNRFTTTDPSRKPSPEPSPEPSSRGGSGSSPGWGRDGISPPRRAVASRSRRRSAPACATCALARVRAQPQKRCWFMNILRWDARNRAVNRANSSSSIAARASELSSDAHPTFRPLPTPTVVPTVPVSSSCMPCPRAREALQSAAPAPAASEKSAGALACAESRAERSVSRAPRIRPPRRSRASSSAEPNPRPPATRARLDCAQIETHRHVQVGRIFSRCWIDDDAKNTHCCSIARNVRLGIDMGRKPGAIVRRRSRSGPPGTPLPQPPRPRITDTGSIHPRRIHPRPHPRRPEPPPRAPSPSRVPVLAVPVRKTIQSDTIQSRPCLGRHLAHGRGI